eukprot:352850-Chlamydomonas_euryale.AAC.5
MGLAFEADTSTEVLVWKGHRRRSSRVAFILMPPPRAAAQEAGLPHLSAIFPNVGLKPPRPAVAGDAPER